MPGDWPVTTQRSSRMRTVSPGTSDEDRTRDDNAWPVPRWECAERSQVRSRMLKEVRSVCRAVDGEMRV
jgi:hypothetical protein